MGNALSGSRGPSVLRSRNSWRRIANLSSLRRNQAAHSRLSTLCLCWNWGDWGNGPNLLLCSLAASRSARCS